MDKHSELLVESAGELGIHLDVSAIEKFEKFLTLLKDWNTKFNLTAIRDSRDIVLKHFIDSLTLIPFLKGVPEGSTLLDIGTGAGFPGIPIAIVCKDLLCTLLDATHKKVRFLEMAKKELGQNNIFPQWGRAETMTRQFDIVTARALGPIKNTIVLSLARTKYGGQAILQRGPKDDDLVPKMKSHARALGAKKISVHKIRLPQSQDQRSIWVLQKMRD